MMNMSVGRDHGDGSELSDPSPKHVQMNRKATASNPLPIGIAYKQELTLKEIRKIGNGRSHGQNWNILVFVLVEIKIMIWLSRILTV